jgi:hypothetical protein
MPEQEDNWYEAIGKFVVEFSKLTYTLWLCIQRLVEEDIKLIRIINRDERIKKIAKTDWFKINEKKYKNISEILRHILTTWEVNKILKSILVEKYSYNLEFLKILDRLFCQIDEFCVHRNDFMHSWLLIKDKNPWKIMVSRATLINWKLVAKNIELNLDELNKKLWEVGAILYGISIFLYSNKQLEDCFTFENWKFCLLKEGRIVIQNQTKK